MTLALALKVTGGGAEGEGGKALAALGVRRPLGEMVPSGGRGSLALSVVVSLYCLEAEAPDSPRGLRVECCKERIAINT